MSTYSKRKSLPHLLPLVIKMAFQPVAPKVFKTPWPHSFLPLRAVLGPGPVEPPILERTKESWLCWEWAWPLKQAGFVFRSIKLCSIKPHQRWEAWERELLMTCCWHLGRGSPRWTWLKIISKPEVPQSCIVSHHPHLPSPLYVSHPSNLAEDALQVVVCLIQRLPVPGVGQGTTAKSDNVLFLVKWRGELSRQRTAWLDWTNIVAGWSLQAKCYFSTL